MEPTSLAAIALTAIMTKTVDKLGDGAIASAQRLWKLLRGRSPEAARRLEAASQSAGSDEVIDVEIVEEAIAQAADDPEVSQAVQETAVAMQQQFGGVVNKGELAKKIGVLVQGGHNTLNINQTF